MQLHTITIKKNIFNVLRSQSYNLLKKIGFSISNFLNIVLHTDKNRKNIKENIIFNLQKFLLNFI